MRTFEEGLKSLDTDLDRAMGKLAQIIGGKLSQVLGTPGKGKVYRRGTTTHRASRPFDPPAPDTNNLRQSVFVERLPDGTWVAGVAAPYAAALEFGTIHMAPRPFMTQALREASVDFDAVILATLETPTGSYADTSGGNNGRR